MKRNPLLTSFVFTVLSTSIFSHAADVSIVPPTGGGFVVKSNDGTTVRFKVNESGQIFIPSLPSALAGKPLCWDQATGLLQVCPVAVGTDFTSPTIETTAPAVATGSPLTFTTTYSDNVELAQGLGYTGYNGTTGVYNFSDGVKFEQKDNNSVRVPLGGSFKGLLWATDTSGNLSKKSFTITSPSTSVKFGNYQIIGNTPFPSDFDCLYGYNFNTSDINNKVPTQASLGVGRFTVNNSSSYGFWSVAEGFRLSVNIRYPSGYGGFSDASSESTTVHPLSATTFLLDSEGRSGSGQNGSFVQGYTGEVRVQPTTPARIEIDISMKCNFNNAGWVNGGKATFTAELMP